MAERAARDAAQFHESGTTVKVHQVPKKTERCYRREGQHNSQTCWALKEECRYCHKLGHIERACRKKHRENRFKKPLHKVKKVDEATPQGEDEDETIEYMGLERSNRKQMPRSQPHTPEDDEGTLEDIHWGTTALAWADHCPCEERKDRSAVATASRGKSGTTSDGSELVVQGAYHIKELLARLLTRLPDGSIRICGDFRVTVNPSLKIDQYPLPRVEDILVTLEDSTVFSKIDLQSAYLQMEWKKNRRNSQPSTPIKVVGASPRAANPIWPDIEQDSFLQPEITYCRFRVDGAGLHKTSEKIQAVVEAPQPENITQLRAFLGPVEGRMFLTVVDAYSKWPEVLEMPNTTTQTTVDQLHSVFARWGIPQQVVSDNGPQFVSQEFDQFMSVNNIKHLKSSTSHPATNGLAEYFVQTPKQALKYQNARHASTETSPAFLMIGQDLHSHLHLLKPDLWGTTLKASTQQVMSLSAAIERIFNPGEKVLVRDYRPRHSRWQSGVVMAAVGIKMYEVQCDNRGLWKRHSDQIRANPVGLELKDSLSSRELSNHVDITTGAHSRAVQPCPSATDEPRPSATDEPRPSATDGPRPSATDEPHPSATDEPRPSATDEPCPSTTEAVPNVSR
eukprot:Em0018g602a